MRRLIVIYGSVCLRASYHTQVVLYASRRPENQEDRLQYNDPIFCIRALALASQISWLLHALLVSSVKM